MVGSHFVRSAQAQDGIHMCIAFELLTDEDCLMVVTLTAISSTFAFAYLMLVQNQEISTSIRKEKSIFLFVVLVAH